MLNKGIPVSVSMNATLGKEGFYHKLKYNKKSLLRISILSVIIAICISFIAKFLVHLIDLITNIAFHGTFSIEASSPADHHLGIWVIFIPVAGGLIVGLMALFGSKAIRGHGIPEAMEQVLVNQSKIKPSITYLKPLSAAISIGTGGPFGAEGPIIATGGALGSTIGQIITITPNERKILLAAGATAGMAAIFGSPIAAILLAIELLLFEFSPRSFVPVALACITGAAGHHLLFEEGVVFPMATAVEAASNPALLSYSVMGIIIGLLAVLITKIVYFIEDSFEKLPVHWAWFPAIGGLVVGVVGYFAPLTLGVGYSNIVNLLSGTLTIQVIISLCVLKFISWAVSLGSGTSGGTLAPLLTIGGATGAMLGSAFMHWFPSSGVTIPLSVLVGMAAMFAGASRAFLTSIVFAMETTGQSNALLPLLATCTASYFISYFLMDNTIMTEKIARRGIAAPNSYEPDSLEKITVEQVSKSNGIMVSDTMLIKEVRDWCEKERDQNLNYLIVSDEKGEYKGILSSSSLFSHHHQPEQPVGKLIKRNNVFIEQHETLRTAAERMAKENVDVLPVVKGDDKNIVGILSYRDIISTYNRGIDKHERNISLKRQSLKILVSGQKLISALTFKGKGQES